MGRTFLTIAEQLAAELRSELVRGRWGGSLPGRKPLAERYGVNHKTVEAAMALLEVEGLLENQGQGRKRRVVLPRNASMPMRVCILSYDRNDRQLPYMIELQHLLEEAGHTPFFTDKTLVELKRKLSRVQRLVAATEADAWIVCAGPKDVLAWFAEQPVPAFALFGRRQGLPIASAGPDQSTAMVAIAEQFISLGHRRIVQLVMKERRYPEPGDPERHLLETLESHGIRTGPYNLPDWEEGPIGFQTLLTSLFQVSPPSALIVDDPTTLFAPVQQFLQRRGLRVPEDVSLIITEPHPYLDWCRPSIAHVVWDNRPILRRILRWAGRVSRGQRDVQQTLTPTSIYAGGTIGPARESG